MVAPPTGSEVPARCPAAICSTPSLVIDGQFHFDARDGHVSHDAGAGHVERFIIFALLRVGHVPPIAVRGEPFIVFVRRFQHGLAFGAGHVFGLFHVACHGV